MLVISLQSAGAWDLGFGSYFELGILSFEF